ncbi:MAG: hypothetical protein EOM05_04550 [Clostridia bacterium]|nr:hypothetical protein [Clostridia bacterium]
MNGKTTSAIKGISLGLAIGGATAMLGNGMMSSSSKRKLRKNANKAIKTVSEIVDNAHSVIK